MRILMVCLGNICRSPLAEGIMAAKIARDDLDWYVDSAGTGSWHIGARPDSRSIAVAKAHGIDISRQRGRQLSHSDLEDFDLVLAMDDSNYENILALASDEAQRKKVHLVLGFAAPSDHEIVPDPYWNDDGFEHVFQLLDEACEHIVAKYKEQ